MESLKEILKKILQLLIKLPVECIKIIKKLVATFLEKISSIINKERKIEKPISDKKSNDKETESPVSTISNDNTGEEFKADTDNKKNKGNKIDAPNPEPIGNIIEPNDNKKDEDTNDVVLGIKIDVNPITEELIIIPESIIKEDTTLKPIQYLFKDIEENEEAFNKIFDGIEKIKNNLSLPEDDLKIYLKKIESLKKEITKLHKKTKIEIENDDIDEDEYSSILTNNFVKILKDNYLSIIQNTVNNLKYKKDEHFKDAMEIFENFLLELGFEKGNFLLKTIEVSDKNVEYFNVIRIETTNENDNNIVKEIERQPYLIHFLENDEDEVLFIPGQLTYYGYGRLN